MTITTNPMPETAERAALHDGRLVPALLQAVRDQAVAPRNAHFAFPLAVPMVAARLNLSARSILSVTESGELLYGPSGQTIAELCEEEVLGDEAEPTDLSSRLIAPIGARGRLAVHGAPHSVEVIYIGLRDSRWSNAQPEHTFESDSGARYAIESDATARRCFEV